MADLAIPRAAADSDVQARRPTTHVSLTRVGVTDVEKVIRIGIDGREQLFFAELECFVDLGPDQKGAHMSRFEEVINEAIDEVVLGEAFKAETLAQHIAERVRDRQGALRAEVRIAARYPEQVEAPVSGSPTQEIYKLFGSAVASEHGTRRLIGVEAQGMTACPCAQEMVADRSRERLEADGFSGDEIERVLEAVPVATHNQRGIGRLYVGCPEGCDTSIEARTLLRIDATEIVDRHVPLEEIWPRQRAARWAEANGQPVAQATLAAVLATIGNELAAATPPDPLIRHVVYRMASRPGISVEEIARDAGLSDRHLRRRMRQSVGYGPKTLQRILRLQRLLWLASADEPHAPNLTRLAFTAGYADQPHMTREVAALTGATPRHVLLHSRRASAVSELFKTLAGEDARL